MSGEESPATPERSVPYGRESFYMPAELPPSAELDFDGEFQQLLGSTSHQLGRLEGIGDEPNVSPVVYTSLVRREAVESVLVEGAEFAFKELFRPDEVDGEAISYERAVPNGADRVVDADEITLELPKELHGILLDGVRDEAEHPR